VPLPTPIAAAVVQTSILARLRQRELWLGPQVGLGPPLIQPSQAPVARRVALTLVAGMSVGALILVLEVFVFAPHLPSDLSTEAGQRVAGGWACSRRCMAQSTRRYCSVWAC
jgi:hypothetical protein